MTIMSKPGWERCKELAEKDQLTESEVTELTGLAPDDELLRKLHTPCPPHELVSYAYEKIELPSKFRYSVSSHQETRRSDQLRDEWINALKKKGIADAPINWLTFTKLVVIRVGNDPLDYQLVRDRLGDVTGLASQYKSDNHWDDDHEIEAETRAAARLSFPTTAQELIVWIRNQSGAAQLKLKKIDAMAFAKLLPATSVNSPTTTVARPRRDNPGRDAILEALMAINATSASDPRTLERNVRKKLLEAAKKTSLEFPFQNDNDTLKVRRSGNWNECDREALVKRIANALPSLSDSSE